MPRMPARPDASACAGICSITVVSRLTHVWLPCAGNMIFLPRGACVIDIVPQNNLDKHGWAFFMAADFRPLGFNPIAVPPQKTVLMLHKVKQSPEWRFLSSHWRYDHG